MFIKKVFNFYKKAISPYTGAQCKFYPTCSEYCLLAIQKYGYIIGVLKTIRRLIRCNPFSHGGVDLP